MLSLGIFQFLVNQDVLVFHSFSFFYVSKFSVQESFTSLDLLEDIFETIVHGIVFLLSFLMCYQLCIGRLLISACQFVHCYVDKCVYQLLEFLIWWST